MFRDSAPWLATLKRSSEAIMLLQLECRSQWARSGSIDFRFYLELHRSYIQQGVKIYQDNFPLY